MIPADGVRRIARCSVGSSSRRELRVLRALDANINAASRGGPIRRWAGFLPWRLRVWIIQTAQTGQSGCLAEPPRPLVRNA